MLRIGNDGGSASTENEDRGIKKYKGVYFDRTKGKWIPRIQVEKKKRLTLGAYPTAEMAAIAYDTSILFLRGESIADSMNFPQYAYLLPRPISHSVDDIRSAARTAAQEITPRIIQLQMTQELESSAAIPTPTSAPMMLSTAGM
jgi:hypothetical protein